MTKTKIFNMNKKQYDKERYQRKRLEILEHQKAYNRNNRAQVNEYQQTYYKTNKALVSNKRKKYYQENKEVILESHRLWRNKNPGYSTKYSQLKCQLDPKFKLAFNLRRRIRHAFVNILKLDKKCHTFEILGIEPQELKIYIENKFQEGMNWDNYGKGGWDIDHIVPLSSAKNEKELIKLCRYTNLQPLWHLENLSKGNKH